jgi:ectoine hydroxylase-related dioxygenase (phytanoyl-CoA dioxygenase family)
MKHQPDEWQKAYQEDGFVVVPDLLDPAVLSRLRDGVDKIIGNLQSLPPHLTQKIFLERDHVANNPQWYADLLTADDCGEAVRQIADLALFDPAFAELICYPPLLDVLEALFASSEFAFTLMAGRPKAARVGNGISNGNFHRDAPFENTTSINTVIGLLCLDDMAGDNGGTSFLRGSHKICDQEAAQPRWRDIAAERLDLRDRVDICCGAGSGIFFSSKVLHASGHNRSNRPRRTILCEWAGPDALPTSPVRHAFQGLRPRSKDLSYQTQVRKTFPATGTEAIASAL